MPNKPREGTSAVTFSLENELLARATYMAEQLEKEHPGLRFSKFDAIRATLAKHLPVTPAGWTPKTKGSPPDSSKPGKRTAKRKP